MFCIYYRRSTEFSNALKHTFEAAVLVELFPRSQIDIYVQVLQSDGGESSIICTYILEMTKLSLAWVKLGEFGEITYFAKLCLSLSNICLYFR